eukprot:126297-Pelagomonas_calceolata.AAC.13
MSVLNTLALQATSGDKPGGILFWGCRSSAIHGHSWPAQRPMGAATRAGRDHNNSKAHKLLAE